MKVDYVCSCCSAVLFEGTHQVGHDVAGIAHCWHTHCGSAGTMMGGGTNGWHAVHGAAVTGAGGGGGGGGGMTMTMGCAGTTERHVCETVVWPLEHVERVPSQTSAPLQNLKFSSVQTTGGIYGGAVVQCFS